MLFHAGDILQLSKSIKVLLNMNTCLLWKALNRLAMVSRGGLQRMWANSPGRAVLAEPVTAPSFLSGNKHLEEAGGEVSSGYCTKAPTPSPSQPFSQHLSAYYGQCMMGAQEDLARNKTEQIVAFILFMR